MSQSNIDPTLQMLLDELNERSYLVRQKQIAKSLQPYKDIAIPVLVKRLKDKSENYYIKQNALETLALSADHRAILPVLRYIEIETGWTGHIFDYLRQGLQEQDNLAQEKAKGQLIKYLEDGPKVPAPEPFDPVKSQNDFMELVSALMKRTGVNELDAESTELVEELKERWSKPPDLSSYEKDRIPEHQNIIVEVVDTLSEFEGLLDIRLPELLSKYIERYGYDSIASQHTLTALAKINIARALACLSQLDFSSHQSSDITENRVVSRNPDLDIAGFEFTICTREPSAPFWDERPYYFKREKELIYFKARGEDTYLWFVGQATDNTSAIQIANRYLERWKNNIDALDTMKTQTGKYSRPYIENRYAECAHLLLQAHIPFERWGFHQTHISKIYEHPQDRPQIIYDSEWCRVKFTFRSFGEMYNQSDVLNVQYGRLHALDKDDSMLWNGQPHHCWHQINLVLCFLDGMSPAQAKDSLWSHPLLQYGGELPQPVQEAKIHAGLWERYGQRLLELFDLRKPELWEQFSAFVKQVYILNGSAYHEYGVPFGKIC